MIQPQAASYYVLCAFGEAAELITSIFSPEVMADITDVIVISHEFSNDIEPAIELDESMSTIKDGLISDITEVISFNPLYIPSSQGQIEDALESTPNESGIRFLAMGGNPYAIRSTKMMTNDNPLLVGTVNYEKFDFPVYEAIIAESPMCIN